MSRRFLPRWNSIMFWVGIVLLGWAWLLAPPVFTEALVWATFTGGMLYLAYNLLWKPFKWIRRGIYLLLFHCAVGGYALVNWIVYTINRPIGLMWILAVVISGVAAGAGIVYQTESWNIWAVIALAEIAMFVFGSAGWLLENF